jgi:hypothetical protein
MFETRLDERNNIPRGICRCQNDIGSPKIRGLARQSEGMPRRIGRKAARPQNRDLASMRCQFLSPFR